MEYELVWNGVNDGRDSDLLREGDRQLVKVRAEPQLAPRERSKYTDLVYDKLPLAENPISFAKLCSVTGLTRGQVNSALCSLRLQQRIGSETVALNRRHRGLLYWRL